MNERIYLTFAFLAGLGIGLAYFAALRKNIEFMIRSGHPWAWALGGFLLRTGVAVGFIAAVSSGRWQGFLACLAGFMAARIWAVRRYGPSGPGPAAGNQYGGR